MARKGDQADSREKQVYDKLVGTWLCLGSQEKLEKLSYLKSELSGSLKDFSNQVDAFHDKISKLSLSPFIAKWADYVREEGKSGDKNLRMMCDLLEVKLLPLTALKDFAKIDPVFILERIRSFDGWSIGKREEMALLYGSFMGWLSDETFGYVSEAKDLDRLASVKRQVPFSTYIKILENLDLRERILAKMFYLGGNRGLEEVLSVKIEDLDFAKQTIHLSEDVSYPYHVFADIKEYVRDRKRGYVFLGKEGERIAHTTSFRALKKAVSGLGLDPEFTFRELTKNI